MLKQRSNSSIKKTVLPRWLMTIAVVALAVINSGCSEPESSGTINLVPGSAGTEEQDGDKYPAKSTFSETLKPKVVQTKPCSDYNLKFYEGDEREFSDSKIKIGDRASDAKLVVNGRDIIIYGFDGQAEEYINYSIYRGFEYDEKEDSSGAKIMTKTETEVTVCFRKRKIAVKQLVENTRARGDLSKTSYLTKQWIWEVQEAN